MSSRTMILYIVLVLVGFYSFQASDAATGSHCPSGYSDIFNGTCYLLSHDSESWVGAMMSCQILGGHLVEIESANEADHIRNIVQGKGDIRWIALTTKRSPGSWEWATSHTKPSYLDWYPGEPDNYNHDAAHDESCAAMDAERGHNYAWSDLECFRHQLYICEAQADPILPFLSVGRRK